MNGTNQTGPASLQFLASRLLFLLTVKGTEIVRTLVDRMAIIAHLHEVSPFLKQSLDLDARADPPHRLSHLTATPWTKTSRSCSRAKKPWLFQRCSRCSTT